LTTGKVLLDIPGTVQRALTGMLQNSGRTSGKHTRRLA
jgi:hypothetical protein